MLIPATTATALVVKPAHPRSLKTRAPASIIASTVARERAWLGSFRIGDPGFLMRVDMRSLLPENVNTLLAFSDTIKGGFSMSELSLLRSLFSYQAWANE